MKRAEELPLQQHPGTKSKFLEEQNIYLIFLLINIRYKKANDTQVKSVSQRLFNHQHFIYKIKFIL